MTNSMRQAAILALGSSLPLGLAIFLIKVLSNTIIRSSPGVKTTDLGHRNFP